MDSSLYDVCVIGAGLWGSAAAYHLSLDPAIKVCLVGPNEPTPEVGFNCILWLYYELSSVLR